LAVDWESAPVSELDIEDRLLYYREIRTSLRATVRPLVHDVLALDALTTIDRLLVGLITVDEFGPDLSAEFGARAYRAVHGAEPQDRVTPEQFAELLQLPSEIVLDYDQQRALAAIELDYLTRRADIVTALMNESGP
jgi:hypothetical protein